MHVLVLFLLLLLLFLFVRCLTPFSNLFSNNFISKKLNSLSLILSQRFSLPIYYFFIIFIWFYIKLLYGSLSVFRFVVLWRLLFLRFKEHPFTVSRTLSEYHSEVYLESSRASTMELFCEVSWRFLAVNYFLKKTSS